MSCKIAIMQPYIFPYWGYFQLVSAVDTFVFYDDVNFIKRGFINRNKLLIDGTEKKFSIPLVKASQNKLIKDTQVFNEDNKWEKIFFKSIEQAYSKAAFFDEVYPLIQKIFETPYATIADLAAESVITVADYLDLTTKFELSSIDYPETKGMDKADRLIAISQAKVCNTYINMPGGKSLYAKDYFSKNNISLQFIEPSLFSYPQFSEKSFVGLSIIDVLMHNSKNTLKEKINNYKLT